MYVNLTFWIQSGLKNLYRTFQFLAPVYRPKCIKLLCCTTLLSKVDIDTIAYAERGEKMHTRKEGAIVEEPGKASACVSLRRRRFRVRRCEMRGSRF
jgi:hypothetical protein